MFNRKYLISLILVLAFLIPTPLYTSAFEQPDKQFAVASGEDWLPGWLYRKSHNITGDADAEADYQILINVEYGSGADSGNTVYLDSRSQTDFGDVRITDANGITELDYWIESKIDGDSAVFWVEVQDDLSSDATIYIYFGRTSTTQTTSNGYATFDVFSDFSRFIDLDTWSQYAEGDSYVKVDDVELLVTLETVGKSEGLTYDGEFFYLSTYSSTLGESWVYQIDDVDFEITNSIEITRGTRTHAGGICLYDGYLYVSLAEPIAVPVYPSLIERIHAETLTYDTTIIESSDFDNDHWGGVVIIESLDRMYVANWDSEEIYVFQIDGTYITMIEDSPDFKIQDFVYVEEDGLIYGSSQDNNDMISVWRPNGNGDTLTKVGEADTESGRTNNGFTWYDGYFYTSVAEDVPNEQMIRKLEGSNINLTIDDYWIYSDTAIGPDVMVEARIKIDGNRKFNFGFVETPIGTDEILQLHNSDGDIKIWEGNVDVDCGFTLVADTWTTLSLGWDVGYARAYFNRDDYHGTVDADILGTALKPKLDLWGSADEPIYCSWIFVRKWSGAAEPIQSDWGSVEVYTMTDEGLQWSLDVTIVFMGLIMIPCSVMYLVRGGKNDMSSDKLFYGLILFLIGWGLFLGGIL